ncbi:MAG: RsmB/NOP family class I SAM-dependent RNA methyltransferase [Armatimonadota bacterium]
MPEIPRAAVRLAARCLPDQASQERFLSCIGAGSSAEPALLWFAETEQSPFEMHAPAPWQPPYVDRVDVTTKVGSHPLHADGAFYCLDLSSVFAGAWASVLRSDHGYSIIDVCASPGGKSLLAMRALAKSTLHANETIGKRVGALKENLKRCGITANVTSTDPKVLADFHGPVFDIVIADVPCSGQSLLARGIDNPGCFHDVNVSKNTGRQRRILAECIRLCKQGGYIAYSTCTYAQSENEGVIEWGLSKHPECSTVEIPLIHAHRSPLSSEFCYRLWPHEGFGAGAFLSLIKVGGD